MKTKIDITSINPDYETSIAIKLENSGIPSCLGNMILPTMEQVLEIEIADYFTDKNAVADKEVYSDNIRGLLVNNIDVFANKVLTKSGAQSITEHKEEAIVKYTEQVVKCSKCTYTDVCFKLTQNMLAYIALDNTNKC